MGLLLRTLDRFINWFLFTFHESVPDRWAKFLAYYYPDARLRKIFLRRLKVEMGQGSFANYGLKVIVDMKATEPMVRIGARVSMGPNVLLISESSPNNSPMMQNLDCVRTRMMKNEPVIIEDDAWLGADVTVLPGVRIGKGAMIAAGAVVTEDVPPFTLAAGVPARNIKSLVSK